MTKKQKRIAIAKDIIAQIFGNQLTINSECGYITQESDDFDLSRSTVSKENLDKVKNHCSVCAIGSMVISSIGLYGNKNERFRVEDGFREAVNSLHPTFKESQLILIETAFEVDAVNGDEDDPKIIKAKAFGARFSTDETRLLAIMTNIVANDGKFKP